MIKKFRFLLPFVAVAVAASLASAEGGVKGKVSFEGKAPKGEAVKMNADPKCLAQHKEAFLFAPIVVGAKGELANVFVYVRKGVEGKKFEVPKEPKQILDQKGCWYYPHVSGLMAGQKLEILNSDPTMHNVNAQPEFNAAMPAGIKPMEKVFKKPTVNTDDPKKAMFKIKCNVHPWMTTYVGVTEHPYYAVTDKGGSFEIKGLPPGKYTLAAWHEKLGLLTRDLEVKAEGATADFKFAAKEKGKS